MSQGIVLIQSEGIRNVGLGCGTEEQWYDSR
jgi:hypothetical protein